MATKEELEFLKKEGWELVKGWKLDHECLADGDVTFFQSKKDIDIQRCDYWTDGDEVAFDDIDDVLDYLGYEETKSPKSDLSSGDTSTEGR